MTIEKRAFRAWGRKMRRRLRHATFPDGYMWKFARVKPDSWTCVAFSGRQVMGWCLVFVHEGRATASVFVNARYRRSGLARRLIGEAVRTHHVLDVAAWDKTSRKLYRGLRDLYPGRITVIDWWKALPRYRRLVRALAVETRNRP